MSTFAKPENALQRAQELIAVNQKDEALKCLRTVITSRRFRVWQKTLETLMLKYIQLCVELRTGKEAKDGLHQYKSICQQVNMASLGVVIKYFLEQAENNAKEAQSKAEKITLDMVEDLEAEETPESFMLGRVSGEDTKDRTDREIVTPWLKFLWETYRTVLDILKNNAKLEQLYQQTAQQAFAFCRKYKRNTEFRRLSELLRTHLSNLGKSYNLQNAVSLSNPESLQMHLETRFAQLNAACDLELWQEAFRSVEDLHGLMMMAKKPPKVYMLANYYERLTKIFWVSGNAVLHAYAWYKFYGLSRLQNKGLTPEELKQMGSAVLLSALCIPIEPQRGGDQLLELDDLQKEKNQRLASLLGPTPIPPRDQFLTELIGRNVLGPVVDELSDLYSLSEQRFSPLDYCQALRPKLEFMATQPNLKQYIAPFQKNIFIRLLQQLSRVYQRLKLSELAQLAYFVDSGELEKSIVEVVHAGYVDARIDYLNSAINFGNDSQESDQLRNQLTQLSRSLQTVVNEISPEKQAEKEAARQQLFQTILGNVRREHEKVIERKHIIEKRKEIKEQINRVKAAAAAAAAAAAKKGDNAQRVAERQRLEREEREREEKRKREEEAKQKEEEDRKAAARKSKLDAERKTQSVATRLDHLERARREEERPLLESYYDQLQTEDKKYYESQMAAFRENQQKAHAKELEEKKRLLRMQPFRAAFEASIMKRREEEYKVAKAAQDKRLESARAEVAREMEKRKAELEERKRREEEKQKAEERKREERRKMEEELRKQEEERLEREAQLRKEEEEEAARAQAEEAERRQREEARRPAEPASRPDVWKRPSERAREREDYSPERRGPWDRRGPERPGPRDREGDEDRWARRGPGERPAGRGPSDSERGPPSRGPGDRDRDRDYDRERESDSRWSRGSSGGGQGGAWSRGSGAREPVRDGGRPPASGRDRDAPRSDAPPSREPRSEPSRADAGRPPARTDRPAPRDVPSSRDGAAPTTTPKRDDAQEAPPAAGGEEVDDGWSTVARPGRRGKRGN